MIVIYILITLILLVLIAGLFISKDMSYEKAILINSSIDNVWNNVSSLKAMDQWNPWDNKDPNMEKTLTGTDGEVGASQAWKSNVKNVGEGSQIIVGISKPSSFRTKLNFIKPFKSEADGYVNLDDTENGIKVTWGFSSTMNYPMNIMKLFMNFEKSMDHEFGTGLNKLKEICEK